MKTYSLVRINSKNTFTVEYNVDSMIVKSAETTAHFYISTLDDRIHLETKLEVSDKELLGVAYEVLFSNYNSLKEIIINNGSPISRDDFFGWENIWNTPTKLADTTLVQTGTVTHPMRPVVEAGKVLYSRYVENINGTVQFRVIDPDLDLETFHEWHNQPRVAEFWEMPWSKEELKAYIKKGLLDPHQLPVIAEINGIKAGYFEIYWTKEDRLGPYYESTDYDRGFHLLVGNTDFLGFKNTDALLKSATHFIFLDDSRTLKIMGEPRHDNEKILKYVLSFKSWRKIKEFDFPHKRAALLECDRALFFQGHYL